MKQQLYFFLVLDFLTLYNVIYGQKNFCYILEKREKQMLKKIIEVVAKRQGYFVYWNQRTKRKTEVLNIYKIV